MLHSLVNAEKYNGCPGRVLAALAAAPDGSAKWQVLIDTDETLAVKEANVRVESVCPFRARFFRGMAQGGFAQNQLAVSINRDRSERVAIYIRDKFPTRRELYASGLDKILEQRLDFHGRKHGMPGMCQCSSTLCPAIASVISQILSCADTAKVSSAVLKLAVRVAVVPGMQRNPNIEP